MFCSCTSLKYVQNCDQWALGPGRPVASQRAGWPAMVVRLCSSYCSARAVTLGILKLSKFKTFESFKVAKVSILQHSTAICV